MLKQVIGLRAAVFIDGAYLAAILKNEYGEPRLAFDKFSGMLIGEGYERLRTYFYYCMPYQSNPPTSEEQDRYRRAQGWITSIRRLPRFEVRLGKLAKRGTSFEQKRVDVLLSVDLVRMSWDHQIQKAVVLSGDSDFVPAVQAAKDAGVLTHLFCSTTSIHDELRDAFDERTVITGELIEKCRI
jgi:uncharacterized LabA/DUF88 family protein